MIDAQKSVRAAIKPIGRSSDFGVEARSGRSEHRYKIGSGEDRRNTISTLLQRAFFSKRKCLKISLNSQKECYVHIGVVSQDQWIWKKIKLKDLELADILLVIEGKKDSTSFYHRFNDNSTQIWIRRSNEFLTIKIKDVSKSISLQEQYVLKILIEKIIRMMSTQ